MLAGDASFNLQATQPTHQCREHALAEVEPVYVGTAAEISSFLMEMAIGEECE